MKKSFRDLFERARKRDEYWIARYKLEFTEQLHRLMVQKGETRASLAKKLGKSPAYITKIFRGNVNFTLESMVRLVRALGGGLRIEMESEGVEKAIPEAKVVDLTGALWQGGEFVTAVKGAIGTAQILSSAVQITSARGTHWIWEAKGQASSIEPSISPKPNYPLPKEEKVTNYAYATA
jgi:transcriptional regulator with XRE-family HTH domain